MGEMPGGDDVLKNKLTTEEFEALDSRDQTHYTESGDHWVLNTDGSNQLKRALKAERRNHDQVVKLLVSLVPELKDESSSDGYVDRKKWREIVGARADLLEELGDDFDIDDFHRMRDAGGDDKPDESEVTKQLEELRREHRQLERDNKKLVKELAAAQEELSETSDNNTKLVLDRDLNSTLDAINVQSKQKRRLARALFHQEMDLKVVDGVTMVTTEDGEEVPLKEFGPDWAATDDGKEFVTAPTGTGGRRNGGEPTVTRKSDEKLSGRQKLAAGLAAAK